MRVSFAFVLLVALLAVRTHAQDEAELKKAETLEEVSKVTSTLIAPKEKTEDVKQFIVEVCFGDGKEDKVKKVCQDLKKTNLAVFTELEKTFAPPSKEEGLAFLASLVKNPDVASSDGLFASKIEKELDGKKPTGQTGSLSPSFVALKSKIRDPVVSRNKKLLDNNHDHRWPNAVLEYFVEPAVGADQKAYISSAIEMWEQHVCVDFKELTAQKNGAVRFHNIPWTATSNLQCSSMVGNTKATTPQDINLSPTQAAPAKAGCRLYAIVHELGHALGLYHTQQRTDLETLFGGVLKTDATVANNDANFAVHTHMGPNPIMVGTPAARVEAYENGPLMGADKNAKVDNLFDDIMMYPAKPSFAGYPITAMPNEELAKEKFPTDKDDAAKVTAHATAEALRRSGLWLSGDTTFASQWSAPHITVDAVAALNRLYECYPVKEVECTFKAKPMVKKTIRTSKNHLVKTVKELVIKACSADGDDFSTAKITWRSGMSATIQDGAGKDDKPISDGLDWGNSNTKVFAVVAA